MNHGDFIVWMFGFPISQGVVTWLRTNEPKKEYSDDIEGFAALILVCIWLGIGWALY